MSAAAIILIIIVIAIMLVFVLAIVYISHSNGQPFTSNENAERLMSLISANGGINNIRYDEFISFYPEGNNVLYYKLKNTNNLNIAKIAKLLDKQ